MNSSLPLCTDNYITNQFFSNKINTPKDDLNLNIAIVNCCCYDDLKLAHFQQALIHEVMKITEKFGQATGMPPAESFSADMIGSQGNYKPWKPRCYACGQPGHFRCDCPKRKEHSSPGTDHKARTAEEKCSKSSTTEGSSDSEMSDSVEAFTASVGSATHQMDK